MNRFTEEKIIQAFRNSDRPFIKKLYELYFPVIQKFIAYNNGTDNDARDVMQDSLLIIHTKISNNEFSLSCSFLTYIYSIVRNLWLKELRKNRKNEIEIIESAEVQDIEFHIKFKKELDFNVKYLLFRGHFSNLTKECKNLLKLSLKFNDYEIIASKLNLLDGEEARKKKFRCKEMLIRRIKKDPKYIKLEEDE